MVQSPQNLVSHCMVHRQADAWSGAIKWPIIHSHGCPCSTASSGGNDEDIKTFTKSIPTGSGFYFVKGVIFGFGMLHRDDQYLTTLIGICHFR